MAHEWIARQDLLMERIGEDTVILDPTDMSSYLLNALGTALWDLLQEKRSAEELGQFVLQEYEADGNVVLEDVNRFLGMLEENGLVLKS